MKMKRTLKRCFIGIMLVVLLGASCLLAACGDNETPPGTETDITIEGVVSSDMGPLSGVAVTLGEESKTTGTAGSYSFEVAEGEYTLTFAKDGYVTQTKTVNTDDAVSGKVTLNVSLVLSQNSDAPQTIYVKISIDSTETPLTDEQAEEAVVKLGSDHTFKYDADKDVWKLEGLTIAQAAAAGDLTVTFVEEGTLVNIYETVNEGVLSGSDYANGQADILISLLERDILPGLTLSEMKNATVLSYDYYQGYRAHNILRSFAKSNPLRSEEQDEGDTIRVIENSEKSETEFNGYIYGVRTIREATKIMTVNMRTHDTSNDTIFGVMVVDLESGARKLIGDLRKSRQNTYSDFTFDLTEYVGKRVLIATGIFYTDDCTRWDVQYVIHHIRFCEPGNDWGSTVDALAGNLLKNTDVAGQSINDFVGSANDKDESNYIFSKWGTASKNFESADYEMNASEGALIKTRDDERNVENCVFLYSKFAIAEQNSYLRFKARGFGGGKIPELAVTVYSLGAGGGVVEQIITPDISAFDLNGNKVTDMDDGWISGTWSTDNYTQFKWDLSGFEGKNVVIMIGLRNTQGGENKIAIQEIHLGSAADGQSAGKVTA